MYPDKHAMQQCLPIGAWKLKLSFPRQPAGGRPFIDPAPRIHDHGCQCSEGLHQRPMAINSFPHLMSAALPASTFPIPPIATHQRAYVTGASAVGCPSITPLRIEGGSFGHVLVVYLVSFSLNARLVRIIGCGHRVSGEVA